MRACVRAYVCACMRVLYVVVIVVVVIVVVVVMVMVDSADECIPLIMSADVLCLRGLYAYRFSKHFLIVVTFGE